MAVKSCHDKVSNPFLRKPDPLATEGGDALKISDLERGKRNSTTYHAAKTKALISCAVTASLFLCL